MCGAIKIFKKTSEGLKRGFDSIREELDNHLDSINGNTSEIQACFDYLAELEAKMNKLTERIDEMQLSLNPELSTTNFDVELSLREQEVFMSLYVAERPMTLIDIGRRIGLTEDMINNIIFKLTMKGIPIKKTFVEDTAFLALDAHFKDLQARKNLLNIDEKVSKEMLAQKLL